MYRRLWFLVTLAALFGCLVSLKANETKRDDFDPNETVELIEFKILVDASGSALSEPIALDLGIGFPLWLDPLGRPDGTPLRFGAIPNQTTVIGQAIEPGHEAVFVFQRQPADASANLDHLMMTPQLLSGLRVSDIGRVGLCSQGRTDWVLQRYELRINGKVFAGSSDSPVQVQDALALAQMQLNRLRTDSEPLRSVAEELRAIANAGLASDAEREQLNAIEESLLPMLREQNLLERKLAGSYPWFVDPNFHSPWRDGQAVSELKVTLSTAAHVGSGTSNYVYYQTGGHKYLLSSPLNPLSVDLGPQTFYLDLPAGPLDTADIRGHSLGMLAFDANNGNAPDRWHPEQVVIEVDGRKIYDSDENHVDRMSLQAIRVIPPVHVNSEGHYVANAPNARETFVWTAGQAMGLDLVNGGALELPDSDSSEFPLPESLGHAHHVDSDEDVSGQTVILVEGDLIIEGDAIFAGDDVYVDSDPSYPMFPGEAPLPPDWFPSEPLWDGSCGCTWDSGWGPGPIYPPPWAPPPGWDDVMDGTGGVFWPPWGFFPAPYGGPIQVHQVSLKHEATFGGLDSPYRVKWELSGNPMDVEQFSIALFPVRLDVAGLYTGPPLSVTVVNDPMARECHITSLDLHPAVEEQPFLFVVPMVVAIPRPGSGQLQHAQMGAAQVWHSPFAGPFQLTDFTRIENGTDIIDSSSIFLWDGLPDPPLTHAEVFRIGAVPVGDGLMVAESTPFNNYVICPGPHTTNLVLWLGYSEHLMLGDGNCFSQLHLGFFDGVGHGNRIRYRNHYMAIEDKIVEVPGGEDVIVPELVSLGTSEWREIGSLADMATRRSKAIRKCSHCRQATQHL
ncbi:MAG: hypothetical protein R3C03_08860 [Pirellulaceae bacterium]